MSKQSDGDKRSEHRRLTHGRTSSLGTECVCMVPALLMSLQSPGTRDGSGEGGHPAEPNHLLRPGSETHHTEVLPADAPTHYPLLRKEPSLWKTEIVFK